MSALQETCPAVKSPRAQIWCQHQPLVRWQSLAVPQGELREINGPFLPVPQPWAQGGKKRDIPWWLQPLCTSLCPVTSALNSSSCHKSSEERISTGREPVLCSCSQQAGCTTDLFSEQTEALPSCLLFLALGFWLMHHKFSSYSAVCIYILYLYFI